MYSGFSLPEMWQNGSEWLHESPEVKQRHDRYHELTQAAEEFNKRIKQSMRDPTQRKIFTNELQAVGVNSVDGRISFNDLLRDDLQRMPNLDDLIEYTFCGGDWTNFSIGWGWFERFLERMPNITDDHREIRKVMRQRYLAWEYLKGAYAKKLNVKVGDLEAAINTSPDAEKHKREILAIYAFIIGTKEYRKISTDLHES